MRGSARGRSAVSGTEVGEHQIPTGEVGKDVGTPERIVNEAKAPFGALLRRELPALQIVDDLGLAGAFRMPQDGGIAGNGTQLAEEGFDTFLALRIALDTQRWIEHLRLEDDAVVAREDLGFRDGRDPFADDAFGCIDEVDRMLGEAALLEKDPVLERMLGMMTRIPFVRDQIGDGVGAKGRSTLISTRDLALPRYQL